MLLKRRWLAFCRRAGAAGREGEAGAKKAVAEAAFADLDRRYREPGRHYHSWLHVASSLRELGRARPLGGSDALALELAIWFHDAVYLPGRQDNEQSSARLALQWAATLGLDPALGQRAAGLIMATRHARPGQVEKDFAEALLLDIDLAVLGARRARYRRYERGIDRELSALPGFREGRARLLRELQERPVLYLTPAFRSLEARARRNLARSIARLTGRPLARPERLRRGPPDARGGEARPGPR